MGAKLTEKRMRGAPCSFKCKQGLQGREGRHAVSSASRGSRKENVRGAKLTDKRTRGAPCSFKCKQAIQGRKRRGAKLTEKRTRGAPFSFKCNQGRKRQGRQIDGRKGREMRHAVSSASRGSRDERGAMQFQVQVGAPGNKTSGEPN